MANNIFEKILQKDKKELITKKRNRRSIKIANNINNYADIANDNINELNNDVYATAIEIVKNFIIDNKRILYGGMAIDAALKKKGDKIYEDTEFPDYDFFSPNFIEDSIIITNKLYDAGYKYVRRIPALHSGTFKIQINFTIIVADITYQNKEFYEIIPTIKRKNMLYVDPDYLKINLYKSLSILYSNYRWKKDIKRLAKLNYFYSNKISKNSIKMDKPTSGEKKIFEILLAWVKENFDFENQLLCGKMAYYTLKFIANYTIKGFNYVDLKFEEIVKKFEKVGNTTIEIADTSGNVDLYVRKIVDFLRDNNNNFIVVYEIFSGDVELIPYKHTIKIVDASINPNNVKEINRIRPSIIIYDYFGICKSSVFISPLQMNIINYYDLLFMLYYYKIYIQENSDYNFSTLLKQIYVSSTTINNIIAKLHSLNKAYIEYNDIFGYEMNDTNGNPNVFKIFQSECLGKRMINMEKRYSNYLLQRKNYLLRKPIYPNYEPYFMKVEMDDIEIITLPQRDIEDRTKIISLEKTENILKSKKIGDIYEGENDGENEGENTEKIEGENVEKIDGENEEKNDGEETKIKKKYINPQNTHGDLIIRKILII